MADLRDRSSIAIRRTRRRFRSCDAGIAIANRGDFVVSDPQRMQVSIGVLRRLPDEVPIGPVLWLWRREPSVAAIKAV